MIDAFSILKFSEFLVFSLLEVWLISISCLEYKKEIAANIQNTIKCLNHGNYAEFVDLVLPLMDMYGVEFGSKIPEKKKKCSDSVKINASILARKSFYLLLFALDFNHIEILRNLSSELDEYLRTYIE